MNQQDYRTRYSRYRKARDIVRHCEYLERHGYRNHPVIQAVKLSALTRMA